MAPIDFSRRHYEEIVGERDEQHPVERAVAAIPDVREGDARARAQAKRMRRAEVRALDAEWVRHEDLRLAQRSIRQARFFDAGFEHGLIVGRAESLRAALDGAGPEAEEVRLLGDVLREAVLDSPLPRELALAVLLDLARALMLESARSVDVSP